MNMKLGFIKVFTFVCMVLILGLQELLQGSWKVPELEATKRSQVSEK